MNRLVSLVDHVVLFELSQRTFGCRALCDAVITPNAAENSLAENLNRHTNASTVRKLFRFTVRIKNRFDNVAVINKKPDKVQLTQTSLFQVQVQEAL